jgi:hypothetical protein
MSKPRLLAVVMCSVVCLLAVSSVFAQSKNSPIDKFRQLEEILPTPNDQRTASGAPGHKYWQQKVDYVIDVELDDATQRIIGKETITYHNNSPDTLGYLWLQLDQNLFKKGSDADLTATAPDLKTATAAIVESLATPSNEYGYNITAVKDSAGAPMPYAIVKTMMRVDLKTPLAPGRQVTFSVDWNNKIVDARKTRARGGLEYFPKV